jgi:putative toxin-antitoxin system antitoxin component (TIGR02293 family)
MRNLQEIAQLLGGRRVLGKDLESSLELVAVVRNGLPYEALEAVTSFLGISVESAAASLQLPLRTLARRKESNRFDGQESERIVRLAALFAEAIATLGAVRWARDWISASNRALGGVVPMTLLDTDVGARAVEDVLLRIGHGVYS